MNALHAGYQAAKVSQPPDLKPRPAEFDVPHGACDCHAHIFGAPARYPFKPNPRYTPDVAGIDEYCHMLATLNVERAVIIQPGIYPDNQVTIDALASSEGRWRGIGLIGNNVTETELDRLHRLGFRGVRVDLRNYSRDGLRDLEQIAVRISPFGWHVQFHLDARALAEIGTQLEHLPVDLVIDHFGHMPVVAGMDHPGFRKLIRLLKDRRCWVKLSAPYRFSDPHPPYASLIPFAKALIDAAPERALWASDWPHSGFTGYMPNDGELLDLLALWAPDPAVRNRILVDNPAALYGFP